MKINRNSSRLLKPSYQIPIHPPTDVLMPLSPFDAVAIQTHVGILYAYRPPNPSNEVIQQGLCRVLAEYREFAGRLIFNDNGHQCILLNDEGMRFIEATCDSPLGSSIDKPSPDYLHLHPDVTGIEELAQVQLTRFACGSMVVGITTHHTVSDGLAVSHFLVAWGQTAKHLELQKTIVMERAHFSSEFLAKLKSKASVDNPCDKPYTTFECLTAHLWRKITSVRNLEGEVTTKVRIAVNGRFRMRNPDVPMSYPGNMVLWAWPRSKVRDLLTKPMGYADRLIHDEIARVDDNYFRSFIDFSGSKEKMEGLKSVYDEEEVVLSPDLDVNSWLKFPFYDLNFGFGPPHLFVPSYVQVEGWLVFLPSFSGTGDIDALISLFEKNTHVSFLYAFKPPNPSNEVIEQGLRRILAEYREFAGRLIFNDNGRQCILLNEEGIRFVEATSGSPLGSLMDKPSPYYLDMHPHSMVIEEALFQVQLTRFVCGSLVVGCTFHHAVSDLLSLSHFLTAWGQTVRNGTPPTA
ncbi:Agmatine coumaroyltransferase-2 [Nymphaea thermarum]|nr:Agmatine coumaroyltransferase-2 [Nymphaea thermarum]